MKVKNYKEIQDSLSKYFNTVKLNSIIESSEAMRLPYSYPCDNYMNTVLSNSLVRKTLQSVIDNFYGNQVREIEKHGLTVTDKNFPKLFQQIKYCCGVLSIIRQPKVIVTSQLKGINALSIDNNGSPLILMSKKSTVFLSDQELQFLLGHELGHIASGNLICHTVKGLLDNLNNKSDIIGPMVSDLVDVPLHNWYRCNEFTADRAGLICCKDLDSVKELFVKLFGDIHNTVSEEYYELSSDHPLPATRLKYLSDFYQEIKIKQQI